MLNIAICDDYIRNKVTDLENTDLVTFWAANNSKKQISEDYDQKIGSNVKIKFNKSGYNKKGKNDYEIICFSVEKSNKSERF